ncbi:hypothetical protein BDF19DRAFT_426388 [Syncephalis fuscata]|nr:hypothetical protein BDF19DRAFT_426388 [Syncephalis fuscata]
MTPTDSLTTSTRLVVTDQPWHYLDVKLCFDGSSIDGPLIELVRFRTLIAQQCQQLYGLAGSGVVVDRDTKYESSIDHSDVSAIWSALAIATPQKIGNRQCSLRIYGASASLMALACPSRSWHHSLLDEP